MYTLPYLSPYALIPSSTPSPTILPDVYRNINRRQPEKIWAKSPFKTIWAKRFLSKDKDDKVVQKFAKWVL